ncbi:hypothetical protein BJD12_10355 [Xanthomonas vesicatoria ATCC 35937]|uniref:Uncharacterized protein n=1 Tax=Xanthomonas vesicatoria ATCC 35937 TaxID=925775 RepID=F0BHL2_9XANT|nr:hypothetical protein BJD12_10355 [Xanthomonas vesicatoria ATCC 35937]EGD08052.1 hypothetical protein XVE_3749 [Xanthomonas vesicatoria ATCC 35937]KTF32645.1 hypothetical protein LMG920_12390 [Xanthomonas vesicatoria]KTF36926.1 hypothetical protein LMG919_09350 [Xanthomonas vesicatoria]
MVFVTLRQCLAAQGAGRAGDIASWLRLGQSSKRGGSRLPSRGLPMPINASVFETAMRRRLAAHAAADLTPETMPVLGRALHAPAQSALPATAARVRSHWFDA